MQPNNFDNSENKDNLTEHVSPESVQDFQTNSISSENNIEKSKKARRILPVVGIGVAILLSIVVGTVYLMTKEEPATQKESETLNQEIALTMPSEPTLEPSVFDYLGIPKEVISAQYTIRPLSESGIPTVSGVIVKDSQGKFTTRQEIDAAFVQNKLDEFNSNHEWAGFGNKNELNAYDQFQIDMLGYMVRLGLVNYTYKEFVENDIGQLNESCSGTIELSNKQVADIVKNLKSDFTPVSDKVSEWNLDLTEAKEHYLSSANKISEDCYDGTRDITDELNSIMKRGLLITKENLSNDSIKITLEYDAGTSSGNPYIEENTEIILTDIKEGDKSTEAFTGPSLFDINNANSFILMIDTCRNLPIIATNFAASFSYMKPNQANYGPSIFDGIFFCAEQEAEDAGYSYSDI